MRPTVYIPIIWGVLGIAIIFLVFLLHGIRNRGSIVEITVSPPKASIFVDNEFFGTDADKSFLPSGSYTLEVQKTGYVPHIENLKTSNRIFGTLFFPSRKRISVELQLKDENIVLGSAINDFSWSSDINENVVFGSKLPLTETVSEVLMIGNTDLALRLLTKAIPFLPGEKNHYDFLTALDRLEEYDPAVFADALSIFASMHPYLAHSEGRISAEVLQRMEIGLTTGSNEESVRTTHNYLTQMAERQQESGDPLVIAGIEFSSLRGGLSYMFGENGIIYPQPYDLPDFFIMQDEISIAQYEQFFSSPFASGYPEDIRASYASFDELDASVDEEDAMRFVSLAGARAFADYINELLSETTYGNDWIARLPYAHEWEYATQINNSHGAISTKTEALNSESIGLRDLTGGVWEWMEQPYNPLYGFVNDKDLVSVDLQEVRGGATHSEEETFSPQIRGMQEVDWKTEFLGFRLVLVPKQEE